jgi:hypothetical protein
VVFETHDGDGTSGHSGYVVRNASELPVRDVKVTWSGGDVDHPPQEWPYRRRLVPPSTLGDLFDADGVPYKLKPGEVVVHGVEYHSLGGGAALVRLRFRDA